MERVDERILEPELVLLELGFGLDLGHGVHGTPLRQATEEQGRVLLRIDAQAHAAPFHDVALARDQVLDRLDAPARARRSDLDVADMEPELARAGFR
jgi:hypothetical protein